MIRRAVVLSVFVLACSKPKQAPPPTQREPAAKPPLPSLPPPAPGTAQVHGRVTYDGAPARELDIELCESGCGHIYRAKTDADGRYVVRDLPPGQYGLLQVRRFDSDRFQVVWSGEGRTDLAANTSLATDVVMIKTDLNVTYPRRGARVSETPTLRWAAYPGAAEYALTIKGAGPPILQRGVKTNSFTIDTALAPGHWSLGISAYSAAHPGQRIADAPAQINFIVGGGSDPEPPDTTVGPETIPPRGRIPAIVEVKPPAGTAAMQGVVMVGDKPAGAIEMKLCELFNSFTGCSGKSWKATTDAQGIYTFNSLPPGVYRGLSARVFKTRDVIFAGISRFGFTTPTQYTLTAGQTLRANVLQIYRADLRVEAPPAKAASTRPEIRWAAYPGAAYYTLTVRKEKEPDVGKMFPLHAYPVAANRFVPEKPLEPGRYIVEIQAFDDGLERIADNGRQGHAFTVGK